MKRTTRRRLVRLAVVAGLLIALGLGGLALLRSAFFADQMRRVLIARGSEALGEDLHVQNLELNLWPLGLEVTGVKAHSRDPLRPGQEILDVERIALEGIRFRRTGRIEVSRLVVSRPRVRLRVGNGELRDFPGLRKTGGGGQGSSAPELFLAELVLEDGAVSVIVDKPDMTVTVEGLDTTLTNSDEDAAEASFHVSDVRLRIGEVEESIVLESGQLHRRGDRFAMDGYRLISASGSLSLSGELFLSPKDDKGAIVGTVGYDIDAVADLDLEKFSSGNPSLPSMTGLVDLHARARGIDAEVQVDGLLEMNDGRFARHVIGDAEARITYADGGVALDRLWVGTASGEVTGTGHLRLGEDPRAIADLQLHDLQLAEVFENNTLPNAWVMLTVSGTAQLVGAFSDGMQLGFDVDLPCRDLRVFDSSFHDRPFNKQMLYLDEGRILGHVEILSDRTLLQDMKILTAHSDLDAEMEFIYHKPVILDLRLDGPLSLDDLGAVGNLPFAGAGPTSAHMYGLSKDLQIDAHTRLAGFGMWQYALGEVDADVYWHARDDLIFEDLVAVLGETTYEGDGRVMFGNPIRIDGALDIDGGRIEDVVGVFSDRLDLTGQFDGGIRVAGPVRELAGDAWARGRRVNALGEEFSSIQVTATASQGRFTISDAWFRKGKGGIYGRGYIDTHGPVDLEVFSYGMDLQQVDHLAESPLTAALALDVHLWGTLREPLLHGHGHLSDTQYARAGLGDSLVDVTLRDGNLRVNGTLMGHPSNRLTGELALTGLGEYEFGLVLHALPLHLLLPARSLARSPIELLADGEVEGHGQLKGNPDHHIDVTISRLGLERGQDRLAAASPIRMTYHDDRLTLEEVRFEGPRSDVTITAELGPGGQLELAAGGELDLALVDIFVPTLKRCEAERTRIELNMTGAWPAEVDAALAIDGASVRIAAFPHPVDVDRGRFSLRDGRIVVEAFEGRLGGGRIEGFEGSSIELVDLRPRTYDVHATCVDCTVRYPSMLPWTRATADLRLTGTAPMVTLQGDIAVEDMTYREDFNWQSSILTTTSRRSRQPGGNGDGKTVVGLDLRVHSDGGFGISNNLGQARASGELRVMGDTREVGLDGEMSTTGGRVWFRGHDFDLTSGTFGFPDPKALDPHFHLELDTDVSTREQRYSIHYDIDGSLSDVGGMQIAGRSDPQLSEADINALLLFGVTTDELQGLGSSSDMMALALQGSNIVFGYLMEQVREAGGGYDQSSALPDRVELVPDYSSSSAVSDFRLVVGKELVRNRLSGEFYWNFREDFGFALDWRVGRNLYLVPSWFRTSESSLGAVAPLWDLGDASLDMRWVIEGD
jgi:translocation and assembly module TamB